jgi:hypothetical protein
MASVVTSGGNIVTKNGQIYVADALPLPQTIAGLAAWYDASDSDTVTLDGSSFVTQWNDKSGNGYHVVPTSADVVRHNVEQMNSLPLVTFGTNRVEQLLNDDINIGPGLYTIFAVWSGYGSASGYTAVNWAWTGGSVRNLNIRGGSDYKFRHWGVTTGGGYFYGQPLYTCGYWDGTTANLVGRRAGIDYTGTYGVTTNATSTRGIRMGNCRLAEIIIYAADIGGTARALVEAYLKTKWGIA